MKKKNRKKTKKKVKQMKKKRKQSKKMMEHSDLVLCEDCGAPICPDCGDHYSKVTLVCPDCGKTTDKVAKNAFNCSTCKRLFQLHEDGSMTVYVTETEEEMVEVKEDILKQLSKGNRHIEGRVE